MKKPEILETFGKTYIQFVRDSALRSMHDIISGKRLHNRTPLEFSIYV